jgi:hypothetical protein
MAYFYGTLNGSRGEATRCGTKQSGMETYCAGWSGAVRCQSYIGKDGKDKVRIEFKRWRGQGTDKLIYDGDMDGKTFGMISDAIEKMM